MRAALKSLLSVHTLSVTRTRHGEKGHGQAYWLKEDKVNMFRKTSQNQRFKIKDIVLEIPKQLLDENVKRALVEGWYEGEELHQLAYILQPDEIVLEIGAGIGLVSTFCALDKRVSRVHAVEANPNLIDVIRHNHDLNGVTVDVHHGVLAHDSGETKFYLHEGFWASSNVQWQGAKEVTVPKLSFPEMLAQVKPSLIVCDIEGGEKELFSGDIDLETVQKVLMEVHQNVIGREGMRELFQFFHDRNFHYDQWHSSHAIVCFSHVDRA